jgi:hypothetical protein
MFKRYGDGNFQKKKGEKLTKKFQIGGFDK